MELVSSGNSMHTLTTCSSSAFLSGAASSRSSFVRPNLSQEFTDTRLLLRRLCRYRSPSKQRYVAACHSGHDRSPGLISDGGDQFHGLFSESTSERGNRSDSSSFPSSSSWARGSRGEFPWNGRQDGLHSKEYSMESNSRRSDWASIVGGGVLALGLGLSLGLLCKPALARSSVATPAPTVTATLDDKGEVRVEDVQIGEKDETENRDLARAARAAAAVAAAGVEIEREGDRSGSIVEDAETDASVMVLKNYLAKNPNDKKALQALLFLRIKRGQVDAAMSLLDKLTELEPDNLDWKFLRAQTHDFAGNLDQAREAFQEILQIRPLSPRALQGLSSVMHKSGYKEEALELVKDAVKLAVFTGQTHEALNLRLLLGQMHTIQGNLDEAMELYKIVIEQNPKDYRPYLCQGLVYSMIGKEAEADRQFKTFQKLCPKDIPQRKLLEDLMVRAKTEARKVHKNLKKQRQESREKGNNTPKVNGQQTLASSDGSSPPPISEDSGKK